jgi:50S ribosomal subunit-associated GTPase HflX
MSDLRPKGIEIELGGQKRELLFTINKIDEIQSETNKALYDAVSIFVEAADGNTSHEILEEYKKILSIMLSNEETKVTEEEIGEMVTFPIYRQVAWKVLNAFGISNPEPDEDDEDDDPKAETGQ